ncbi:SET and MYND domain-containing protein DDB_G0273589 [Microplitis mediator]|uniref:SET and MYND domain-containing protein DDB_G0273589 n=1 Tax=Microplitis mediator TaxID=375433 RepID=UPI002552EE53|nr:SET and MYND domain-containing protein DDB_G0273589 [Microplitis mediator]
MEELNDIEFYRRLCSSETLHSGKRGFFKDFIDSVRNSVEDSWIENVFGALNSDEERIRCIFTEGKIKHTVMGILTRVKPLFRDKDGQVSINKRLEGLKFISSNDNERALLCFSQAVLRAPDTGKNKSSKEDLNLSLALLGRAEALMALGEYEFAINDLKAIDIELPQNVREQLDRKLQECHRLFEESKKSIVTCESASGIKKREWNNNYHKPVSPEVTGGLHPLLPGISKLVEIQETTEAGKHAVAAEDVQIGNVLACETPLASCLLPEYYGTHCHHCFVRLRAPVGCSVCSSVAFCGRNCRDEALKTYHKYECKILVLLIGSGMSILSMLALRMVTQVGLQGCLRLYQRINEKDNNNNLSKSQVSMSKSSKRRLRKKKLKENYSSSTSNSVSMDKEDLNNDVDDRAYDLVTLKSKRSNIDFFERTLMAIFIIKCLQQVHFFKNISHDSPTEEEISVGTILLRNLQLLQFNAHEIFETRVSNEHRFRGSKTVYLGVAIYPGVARFNHDCYPAVTRYFSGRDIVIRATRTLTKGQVIAENYGPIFTKRNLKERQRSLEGRYWFKCTCDACKEDWPKFEVLINCTPRIRCSTENCKGLLPQASHLDNLVKCSRCRKKINLKSRIMSLSRCEENYTEGLASMEQENSEEAIDKIAEALEEFHKIASAPHRETHLAEIALAACMADSGNRWRPTFT